MKINKVTITTLITEAVSKRIQAIVDKENEKLKSDFKSKVVKEQSSLRAEDLERLDGLVDEQELVALRRAVLSIIEDAQPEGFNLQQVIEYIKHHTEEVARRFTSMQERKLTKKEKTGLTKIHKDVSKKPFIKQYGKEEGEKVYYATTTKMAKKKY